MNIFEKGPLCDNKCKLNKLGLFWRDTLTLHSRGRGAIYQVMACFVKYDFLILFGIEGALARLLIKIK